MFIHELPNWPNFHWDIEIITSLEMDAMHKLGYLAGRMAAISFDNRLAASVESLTNDVVASSAIEGVKLDTEEVRSSVARKFGISIPNNKEPTHYVDGIVEMMLDATRNLGKPLDDNRLKGWHCSLFPNSRDLTVGEYRKDEKSVVSGMFGRERIHYRAPSPERVLYEMQQFLEWFNSTKSPSSILKSAIAHLWFVSIHPFDDGNGRIARAISDMVLAKLDGDGMHFYSFSRQILNDKKHYYEILEKTQRGDGNLTEWLRWYFSAFISAIENSNAMLSQVLRKATFWNTFAQAEISERQRGVLNRYLDGYDAKLTIKNWAKIAGVSTDTAKRDIDSLMSQGILVPTPGRVRDIPYSIVYTHNHEDDIPFTDLGIEIHGHEHFIVAKYPAQGDMQLRDKISQIDYQRFQDGEITLSSLAYKHFAYLMDA